MFVQRHQPGNLSSGEESEEDVSENDLLQVKTGICQKKKSYNYPKLIYTSQNDEKIS